MSPENELCIRHRGPFERLGIPVELLAQVMGRDELEGRPGTAVCGGCLTSEERTALREALPNAEHLDS